MIDVTNRVASLAERTERAWRRENFAEGAFASVAHEALSYEPLFGGATDEQVLTALCQSRSAVPPSTALRAESITLFEGPRFAVRVRTSLDELAVLRSAGTSGALQLLTGAAIYGAAAFAPIKEFDTNFAFGVLTRKRFEILEAGSVVAFEPSTIHSVSPLARAGAWLVLETNERLGGCSVPFVFPGVRVALDTIDNPTDHRLKCFRLLHQLDSKRSGSLLASTLEREDPRTAFLLLRHAVAIGAEDQLPRLHEATRAVFGEHNALVIDSMARLLRSRILKTCLKPDLPDTDRLLAAALDWAVDRPHLEQILQGMGERSTLAAGGMQDRVKHMSELAGLV